MSTDVILQNSEEAEERRHRDQVSDEQIKEKQLVSSQKFQRFDSLDIESRSSTNHRRHSKDATWSVILTLAFQSIRVVYGDLGTSPLYVFSSTFPDGIKNNDDILGVLSLILYTVTLIPLIKYVLIVLQANDNGDGSFALYSLLRRYAKISLTPSQQAEDSSVSNFRLDVPSRRLKMASRLKSLLQSSQFAKVFLLFATLLGTSMVIGDGVLTPCISVLSAVVGIKGATTAMTEDMIVWISVAILVLLFMIQRFGTDRQSGLQFCSDTLYLISMKNYSMRDSSMCLSPTIPPELDTWTKGFDGHLLMSVSFAGVKID